MSSIPGPFASGAVASHMGHGRRAAHRAGRPPGEPDRQGLGRAAPPPDPSSEAASEPMPCGAVARHVDVSAATLSHHMKKSWRRRPDPHLPVEQFAFLVLQRDVLERLPGPARRNSDSAREKSRVARALNHFDAYLSIEVFAAQGDRPMSRTREIIEQAFGQDRRRHGRVQGYRGRHRQGPGRGRRGRGGQLRLQRARARTRWWPRSPPPAARPSPSGVRVAQEARASSACSTKPRRPSAASTSWSTTPASTPSRLSRK